MSARSDWGSRLGSVGIWSQELRAHDAADVADAAAELESMGFGALWIPGRSGGDVFGAAHRLLDATSSIIIATGIVNVWAHEPAAVAAAWSALNGQHPSRFLLGLGISHPPLVARLGRRYERPMETMRRYLDELDGASPTVGPERRVLAALGPQMLGLAALRAAGAHPYLVTVEHTASARAVLGEDRLLATELHVVHEREPTAARSIARATVAHNLSLPSYAASFRRLGYREDELVGGGSDRLIDATVAWGSADRIIARVKEHHDAGADHVCLQVISPGDGLPRAEWRLLANALN